MNAHANARLIPFGREWIARLVGSGWRPAAGSDMTEGRTAVRIKLYH